MFGAILGVIAVYLLYIAIKEVVKVINEKEFWIGVGMTTIYCIVFYSMTFILVILCNMGIESIDILFGLNIEIAQPILYIILFIIWVGLYYAISKYYYPTFLIFNIFIKVITFGIYNNKLEENSEDEYNIEEIYDNVIDFKSRYEMLKR